MKTFQKGIAGLALGVLLFGIAGMVYADESQNWKIEADNSGQIMKTTYSDPETALGVEKEISIRLSPMGKPVGGTVLFKNGYQRELKSGELSDYFNMFSASRAAWDFWQSQDRLVIQSSEGKIPSPWFGRMTRIITPSGKHIIGRLSLASTEGDYLLDVDGSCCGTIKFSMAGIQQIQQVKSNR